MAFLGINKDNRVDFFVGLSIMISSYIFFREPFEGYFHYLIFLGLFPTFISRFGWNALPLKFIAIPALFTVVNLISGNCELFGFIKVFVGMLMSIAFYNYVLMYYDYDFRRIFEIYLKGIIICAVIGIVQVVSFRVGFSPGYDYHWLFNKWGLHEGSVFGLRVNSVFSEPSQFALVLLPAAFISIHHIFFRQYTLMTLRQCLLILGSLVLTTSSTGYIGIFISFLLIGINIGKILDIAIILVFSIVGFFALYSWIPDFKKRIDSSFNLWTKTKYTIDDINTSSFVLFNNSHVTWMNFQEHPLMGSGLGSYPQAYEKYSLTKDQDFAIKKGFDFNSQDGNSLFLRSVAEVGILGFGFWIYIIFRYSVRRNRGDPDDHSWIYSCAMLIIIYGYLIRQGNYFLNGFPFFVLFYVYLGIQYKAGKTVSMEEEDNSEESAEKAELIR